MLKKPLADVPGLPSRFAKLLVKEGIATAGDVVWLLPFRHEDRRRMDDAVFHPSETPVCHHVIVTKTSNKFFGRRRGSGVFEAHVQPASGAGLGQALTLRWWNMLFMSRAIAEGQELIVFGRIKEFKGRLFMDHPEYETVRNGDDDDTAAIHTSRITPIYRLRGGLTQKAVRAAAWHVLEMFGDHIADDLLPPPSAEGEFAGWSRSRALHTAHFPATMEELEAARRYLALEEFFGCQVRVVRRRRAVIESGGRAHPGDGSLAPRFLKSLPFELTSAQKRSLHEITRDMAATAPMNRLLHGDVGSGKTVVAFAAMLAAVESGSQAAFMAPTQILAEQHFQNARKFLEPLGVRIALRTGSTAGPAVPSGGSAVPTGSTAGSAVPSGGPPDGPEAVHPQPGGTSTSAESQQFSATAGPAVLPGLGPQIIIGTHALLHDRDLIQNLGLVVIDEQHKFGVAQRMRLIQKGRTPDVLVMTATPIPRTLTLTIYGDLDVSTIDERPRERGKIITKTRSQKKMAEAAAFLREQIEAGRQGYLVYPLIKESEKLDAAAAKKGHEEWSRLLQPHRAGLLHGKLSAEEKEAVMRDFRSGQIQALVSTTVVEVGVDVPNATVMLIHNAERYGLAQLHQLRGRIGRGAHTSYCVLFIKDDDEEARLRLAILEETDDGFRIAEEDLKRRGPGDVLGRAQSGQAPLRFAELLADTRLVRLARQLAERALDADPQLIAPGHEELRRIAGGLDDQPQSLLQ